MLKSSDTSKEKPDVRNAYKAGLEMRDEFNTFFSRDLERLSQDKNNARKINDLLKKGVEKLGGKVKSVPVGHEKLYSDKDKMNAHPSALRYDRDGKLQAKESFVIYTPEGDHPEIENWAIAFELGHYFLHPNDQDWYMGGAIGVDEKFNDEAAAFSVAFLLPNEEVKKKYAELTKSCTDENKVISRIADFFGVWDDIVRRHINKICR